MAKDTYYVTQEQLDFLNTMYEELYSLDELLNRHTEARNLFDDFSIPEGNAALRYLGGDTSIEFKAKEQLYLLKRTTFRFGPIYFNKMGDTEENDYCFKKSNAFTAPLEEIKKWKTPAWEIEEVK